MQQRHQRHVHGGNKSGFAAGDGLQSPRLQAVAHRYRNSNRYAGLEFLQRQTPQRFKGDQPHGYRRRRKAQADKKERIAEGHRVLDGKKGPAPEHGDENKDGFLRFNGEFKA